MIIQRVDHSFKKVALDTEYIPQTQTLQIVTNNGNFTTNDVKVENLYINQNGPDATSYVYFYDGGAQNGQYLRWLDASIRFEFSNDLGLFGNLLLNSDATDADVIITFQKLSGSQTLRWDKTNSYFNFDAKLHTAGDLASAGNLILNDDSGAVDVTITFTKSAGSQTLKWDNSNSRFNFNADLKVDGDLGINVDQGNVDAILYFYKPTSGSQTLRWDKTNNYFNFDAKVNITGDLNVTGTITGSGISATLQQVTDNGNTTSHDLKIQNLYIDYDGNPQTVALLTLSDAGYLDSDNTPTSGTLTWGQTALHDGNLTVQAIAASGHKDSAGIDLGSTAYTITKFRLYDANTSENGIYGGGGFDSLSVYYSDDATNWTSVQTFDPVVRTAGSGYHYVEITLSSPNVGHRYYKLWGGEIGALAGGSGTQLNKTEVEAYGYPTATDESSFIYFFDAGVLNGQYLQWDETNERFNFSTKLHVTGDFNADGDLGINFDAGNVDSKVTFYKPTSGSQILKWDKTNSWFNFDAKLVVTGDFASSGNLEINSDASNDDAVITFDKPTSGSATLRWDKTNSYFTFSDAIKVANSYLFPSADGVVNQILVTNGAGVLSWINFQSEGGNAGIIFYLDPSASSDIGGAYKVALRTPSANTETTITQANTGTGDTLIGIFATELGQPNSLLLPAGVAFRHFHVTTGGSNQVGRLKVELYKRTAGGTETLLRTGYSPSFFGTTIQELVWNFTDSNGYALNLTDRLVFRIYTARVSGAVTCNVTVYFDGTANASYIQTTINSTETLDSVCGRGSVTSQPITAASFTATGDLTLNSDSGDVDVVITFTKASGSQTLRWDRTNSYFNFDANLHVAGTFQSTGNITGAVGEFSSVSMAGDLTLNDDSGNVDVVITFTKASGSETLKWDHTNTRFLFSNAIYVTGNTYSANDLYLNAAQANANVQINFGNGDGGNSALFLQHSDLTFHFSKGLTIDAGDLNVAGVNLNLNTNHAAGDVSFSFGKVSSGFATMKWDATNLNFHLVGADLWVDDNLRLNAGAAAADVTITFKKASGSQALKWDNSNSWFNFDAKLTVTGDITSSGNLTLNSASANNDVIITFNKSSGNQTLRWDKTNLYFKFDAKLYAAGDVLSEGNLELDKVLSDVDVTITFNKVAQTAVNTGFFAPTSTATGAWTNGANVKVSDNAWANDNGFNNTMTMSNFNLPAIPFGSVIVGIEVDLEGQAYGTTDGGTANVGVEISWDGGTTFSTGINHAWLNTTPATAAPTGANDTTLVYGGATTLFAGHSWVYTDFTNTNLVVRLRDNGDSSATHAAVDFAQIKVFYKPPASQIIKWDKTNLWFNVDSAMQIQGSFAVPVFTRTFTDYSAYTFDKLDHTIIADCTNGAMTITLPTAVGITGRIYILKKKDNSANNLVLNTTSSQTIDGVTTLTAGNATQYNTVMVQSDGANWIVLQKYAPVNAWA